MFSLASLWKAPQVNPVNKKARSIPMLNPFNMYGRVFFFSWFGFMIAFWSWYAFPPLLSDVIAKDLKLKQYQIANSNIISLVATLLIRLVAGPMCDLIGPRYTFAGCLFAGAIPTFLAGTVHNASGIMALRFFIGILGGSFVPCQVWSTGFFDKNVVGTANSLTGGFGNAGGGITYFVMPAVFNSLVRNNGLTPHVAWRVAFIVPGILIVATATALVLLCDDSPTGKWADRQAAADRALQEHNVNGGVVAVPGEISATRDSDSSSMEKKPISDEDKHYTDHEAHIGAEQMVEAAKGEVVQKPTFREIFKVIFSPQTMVTGALYFCSFGAELAINSILGNYYTRNFPRLSLQNRGNWAAMFGLLNVVFRPLGGILADVVYKRTSSVWAKRVLLHTYGVITGIFLIIIGKVDSRDQSTMFGLIAGMAFFLEGGNGLNFAYVPHVHPYANGVVSGFTGACGNLGGIIFAIIFRFTTTKTGASNFPKVFWIIGIITIAMNIAVSWIKPIPKGQLGGR
ncbi:nitrate transporter [Venturia nashicola]|uniref:Nitrate/nitrite transporter n=1 Tax=Venturia nashicola TaxID=86259 RepID=A0A4Z1P351_9PEZI|nr:nitrate transporter [Venturia nashicola]TLD20047.1 nitrate transporter [Venturia nashicola]